MKTKEPTILRRKGKAPALHFSLQPGWLRGREGEADGQRLREEDLHRAGGAVLHQAVISILGQITKQRIIVDARRSGVNGQASTLDMTLRDTKQQEPELRAR